MATRKKAAKSRKKAPTAKPTWITRFEELLAAARKLANQGQAGERDEAEIPAVPVRPQEPPYRPSQRPMGRPDDRYRGGPARPSERPAMGRPARSGGRAAGMARIYIGAGREAGIRPGDLVGAIANEAKVNSNMIGAIEIESRFSLVDVPEAMAQGIIQTLGRARIKGQKVPVRIFRD